MTTLPLLNPQADTDRISAFISKVFTKTHKSTAIIAISGGVDSATSLMLAARALTPNQVYALHLPAKNTAPIHTQHAYLAMDAAHIPPSNRLTIPIGALIQKSWRIIKHSGHEEGAGVTKFSRGIMPPEYSRGTSRLDEGAREHENLHPEPPALPRLRLANLAARIRMTLLFDQAKRLDALVIGTENRSESLLGYFTRFGDSASDLEPLAHLYKTQVYVLAKHLGVPVPILTKAPSANLWPGQTDTNELGFTYQAADPLLYLIDQHLPLPNTPLAHQVQKVVRHNAFKHQVPYHP